LTKSEANNYLYVCTTKDRFYKSTSEAIDRGSKEAYTIIDYRL